MSKGHGKLQRAILTSLARGSRSYSCVAYDFNPDPDDRRWQPSRSLTSALYRAMKTLEREGVVTKLGKFEHYGERGRRTDRWALKQRPDV
jgi:hypothetical protein